MQQHLKRKDGRYYWRVRVPADLAPVIGRRELCRSLDTAETTVAKRRAKLVGFKADHAFALMRATQLSTQDIDRIVRQLLTDELERHEKALVARNGFDPEAVADGLDSEADKWRDALQRDLWWEGARSRPR